MTRTGSRALVMVGGFIALLVVVSVSALELSPEWVRGTFIGAGLGLVNLAVGYLITRRALLHGMRSAVGTLAGGFIARLTVLATLIVLFQRTRAADPAAFALSFLVFFFVFLGVEVVLVERSLGESRRSA
jgi:hypothetical protein